MSEQVESRDAGLMDGIKKNAGLTVVSGIILLIAGTLAIFSPFVAGVSITMLVGAMLAVSGIGQCFLAFKTGGWLGAGTFQWNRDLATRHHAMASVSFVRRLGDRHPVRHQDDIQWLGFRHYRQERQKDGGGDAISVNPATPDFEEID